MSLEPTEDDIEWMTEHALKLREARLAKLGKGAKLSRPEEDAILVQALEDGEKRARKLANDRADRAAHQLLMDKRAQDEKDRAAGKPTLKASFADLLAAKGITVK